MRTAIVVTAIALGCASTEASTPGDSAIDSAVDSSRGDVCPNYECFGAASCDGVRVTVSRAALLPCGSGATCPSTSYTCVHGCRAGELTWTGGDPASYCEENRAKAPGDPCSTDTDCAPAPSDGGATSLSCDVDAGSCVLVATDAASDG